MNTDSSLPSAEFSNAIVTAEHYYFNDKKDQIHVLEKDNEKISDTLETQNNEETFLLNAIRSKYQQWEKTANILEDDDVKALLEDETSIAIFNQDHGVVQLILSSVAKAARLVQMDVKFFRKLKYSKNQFAFIGRVVSVLKVYFYPGCPELFCREKACRSDGNGSFTCKRCERRTRHPKDSVMIKLHLEHKGHSTDIVIFNNLATQIFSLSVPQMHEIMQEENGLQKLWHRVDSTDMGFIVRPHVWEAEFRNPLSQWNVTMLF